VLINLANSKVLAHVKLDCKDQEPFVTHFDETAQMLTILTSPTTDKGDSSTGILAKCYYVHSLADTLIDLA
jgi:hypothetical protein